MKKHILFFENILIDLDIIANVFVSKHESGHYQLKFYTEDDKNICNIGKYTSLDVARNVLIEIFQDMYGVKFVKKSYGLILITEKEIKIPIINVE